jgi:hypothetical protein
MKGWLLLLGLTFLAIIAVLVPRERFDEEDKGPVTKEVEGPTSGGTGTAVENTTGGLGIPRNQPLLYGGMHSYTQATPTSASLGTDAMSKFLPYSRVPGDQDLFPDPYRLGQFFSTSSYSTQPKDEPAPVLADFSAFTS